MVPDPIEKRRTEDAFVHAGGRELEGVLDPPTRGGGIADVPVECRQILCGELREVGWIVDAGVGEPVFRGTHERAGLVDPPGRMEAEGADEFVDTEVQPQALGGPPGESEGSSFEGLGQGKAGFQAVCLPRLGDGDVVGAELEAEMAQVIATYACEWQEAVSNPEARKRFRTFVNADGGDEQIVTVEERGQRRPATDAERATLRGIPVVQETPVTEEAE